jgi:hypothetical protein
VAHPLQSTPSSTLSGSVEEASSGYAESNTHLEVVSPPHKSFSLSAQEQSQGTAHKTGSAERKAPANSNTQIAAPQFARVPPNSLAACYEYQLRSKACLQPTSASSMPISLNSEHKAVDSLPAPEPLPAFSFPAISLDSRSARLAQLCNSIDLDPCKPSFAEVFLGGTTSWANSVENCAQIQDNYVELQSLMQEKVSAELLAVEIEEVENRGNLAQLETQTSESKLKNEAEERIAGGEINSIIVETRAVEQKIKELQQNLAQLNAKEFQLYVQERERLNNYEKQRNIHQDSEEKLRIEAQSIEQNKLVLEAFKAHISTTISDLQQSKLAQKQRLQPWQPLATLDIRLNLMKEMIGESLDDSTQEGAIEMSNTVAVLANCSEAKERETAAEMLDSEEAAYEAVNAFLAPVLINSEETNQPSANSLPKTDITGGGGGTATLQSNSIAIA